MKDGHVENAFDFLDYMRTEDVVSSVYYSLRLIKHRRHLDFESGISFIAEGVSSEPTGADRETALRIIGRIEASELTPLQQLSEAAADKYIDLLSDIVLGRTSVNSDLNITRGEELLNKLRSESI